MHTRQPGGARRRVRRLPERAQARRAHPRLWRLELDHRAHRGGQRLRQAHGLTGFAASSPNLSLAAWNEPMWPRLPHGLGPRSRAWYARTQMPLFAWSSQATASSPGATGRRTAPNPALASIVRTWFNDGNFRRLERARELAKRKGVTPAQVALAYVLCQPFPTFALIGPQTIDELSEAIPALGVTLTPDELRWLNLEVVVMFTSLSCGAIGIRTDLANALALAHNSGFQGVEFSITEAAGLAKAHGVESVRQMFAAAGVRPAASAYRWSTVKMMRPGAPASTLYPSWPSWRLSSAPGAHLTWLLPFSDELTFAENFSRHVDRLGPAARILAQHGIRLGLEFQAPATVRAGASLRLRAQHRRHSVAVRRHRRRQRCLVARFLPLAHIVRQPGRSGQALQHRRGCRARQRCAARHCHRRAARPRPRPAVRDGRHQPSRLHAGVGSAWATTALSSLSLSARDCVRCRHRTLLTPPPLLCASCGQRLG